MNHVTQCQLARSLRARREHATRAARARLGTPRDGAQRGGAIGLPVRRRNAATRGQPHFGVTPLGGKTVVAQQRGRRPPQILAAWVSPSRWRGRPRVGSSSGPPVRRRNAETRVPPHFGQNAARRQNCRSSATRETTPANPGRPGQPIAMARSLAGRLNHPVLRVCAADTERRGARPSQAGALRDQLIARRERGGGCCMRPPGVLRIQKPELSG